MMRAKSGRSSLTVSETRQPAGLARCSSWLLTSWLFNMGSRLKCHVLADLDIPSTWILVARGKMQGIP